MKEIDVLFGNFQLKIDNKRVANHKEPFVYDENLFVSMSDLAKGLKLGMNVRGKNIHLKSNNKLNPQSDNTNIPIVFQRGYEIVAKERIIEGLEDEIRILSGKDSASISYNPSSKVRNVNVEFGGLSIYLDGKKLNLGTEPIKYKDDVYVALDTIATYLYITPTLSKDKSSINIDGNGILTTHNMYTNLSSLLGFREGRNYLLDIQREELEKRKYFVEELKLPYKKITSISSLEQYLNSSFNKIGDLTVEFKVVEQSGWINLDISFPSTRNFNWYKLKRSDAEGWIWNIYTAIVNLYDKEALISGVVKNPYHNNYSNSAMRNYITFYTKNKDLYFDFTHSKLGVDNKVNPGYLVEALNRLLKKDGNINFYYESNMSGNDLELIVRPSSNDFKSWSLYRKIGYLKKLNQEVRRLYPDITVDGKIVYPDDKTSPIDFQISENRIRSTDLLNETMDHLNINYGRFSHGNNDFTLNYSLFEKDLKDFHLVANGNFSVKDKSWINSGSLGEEKLSNRIQNALSFVISLWDANISTEVLDKDGIVIKEFNIYQENVSIVSATPPSGEIVEGSKVMLYTSTHGARIYYTTDGSTPTTSSYLYDEPIEITRDVEIIACGYKNGLGAGPASSFNYTVVRDQGLSYGLTGLNINHGTLNPNFSTDENRYNVNVNKDVSSISITPYATGGEIRVAGEITSTGQPRTIPLANGQNTIPITVKEDNKREKSYTITVIKEAGEDNGTFRMEGLQFNTTFGLIFKGRVSNINVNNFSGYEVRLYTKSGDSRGSVNISPNGDFTFPSSSVDWFDKIIGFKYEVYDSNGNKVLFNDLN